MISRRCLICANINPCSRHSDADQRAELARNDAAIAEIRGSRIKPAAPSGEASPLSAELGSTGTDRGREAISRLQHSLALAVEALGPFAEFVTRPNSLNDPRLPDDSRLEVRLWNTVSALDRRSVGPQLGDFRRAATALSKLTGGG